MFAYIITLLFISVVTTTTAMHNQSNPNTFKTGPHWQRLQERNRKLYQWRKKNGSLQEPPIPCTEPPSFKYIIAVTKRAFPDKAYSEIIYHCYNQHNHYFWDCIQRHDAPQHPAVSRLPGYLKKT